MSETASRLDRWLWFARFFKSRTRATSFCETGRVRVNGVLVGKAHHPVRPGDVLTFPLHSAVRIIRILALSPVRGPASAARLLYEDLAPPPARPKSGKEGEIAGERRADSPEGH